MTHQTCHMSGDVKPVHIPMHCWGKQDKPTGAAAKIHITNPSEQLGSSVHCDAGC